jgi:hypothetical protein
MNIWGGVQVQDSRIYSEGDCKNVTKENRVLHKDSLRILWKYAVTQLRLKIKKRNECSASNL